MKKKKLLIIILCLVIIIGAVAFYLLRNQTSSDEVVDVQKVSDYLGYNGVSADRFTGVVQSLETVEYKRTGDTEVAEFYVKEGDTVEVDTPLFKYDVKAAQNNIDIAKLEIEGYNQQISALAGYTDPSSKLEVIQLQTQIKTKQVEINSYQELVNQAVIKSSIAGIVKEVNEEGSMDASGNEKPLVTISQSDELRVKAKINEQQIYLINVGDSMIIRSRTDDTKTWKGTISKIEQEPAENNTDSYYSSDNSETSSQYPFYIEIEDSEGLMLGQHVFVESDSGIEPKDGLWLDYSFIVEEEDGTYSIWVSENKHLKKRTVEIGQLNEEDYTVEILSGLSEDDYIAWPDESLKEGMKASE